VMIVDKEEFIKVEEEKCMEVAATSNLEENDNGHSISINLEVPKPEKETIVGAEHHVEKGENKIEEFKDELQRNMGKFKHAPIVKKKNEGGIFSIG
jgi:hypothetical protein